MKLRLRFTVILIPLMLAMLGCKPAKYVGKETKGAFHNVKKEL